RSYDDFSDRKPIAELTAGLPQTVVGEVVEIGGRNTATGKELLSVVIKDESGILEGVWFNQTFMAKRFRYGQRVAFSGKPKRHMGHWQMNSPRVKALDPPATESDTVTRRQGDKVTEEGQVAPHSVALSPPHLVTPSPCQPGCDQDLLPIYPLTEGLHAEQMRRIQKHVAETYSYHVTEILPPGLIAKRKMPGVV